MCHIILVCAFLLLVSCATLQTDISISYFIKLINSKQSSWRAGRLSSLNSTNYTLNAIKNPVFPFHPPSYIDRKLCNLEGVKIPESFDARTKWPECKHVIGKIRNQGTCNSCWAFAATSVMSDRLCIQSNGKVQFEFSAEDLVSCCSYCDYSCRVGYIDSAWKYWLQYGIVSGGDATSNKGCKPYQESEFFYATRSSCNASCDNPDYNVSYAEDKRFGSEYYIVDRSEQCIQAEIMEKGPVQAVFTVFQDFSYYKDGVYEYTIGGSKGAHTVKILGWGTENGIPYWLAANSWGCVWGSLDGFFKIRRGRNECGIEQFIITGNSEFQFKTHSNGSHSIWLFVSIVLVLIIISIVVGVLVFNKNVRTLTIKYLRLKG